MGPDPTALILVTLLAIVAFCATNLDDIVVVTLLFSGRIGGVRPAHIVAGTVTGYALLVGASLVGLWLAHRMPMHYVGFLGLIPLTFGIRHAWHSFFRKQADENQSGRFSPPPPSPQSRNWRPFAFVTGLTVGNGGDNIGIYIPLFAAQDRSGLLITLTVFFVLILALCMVGWWLARRSIIVRSLRQFGRYIIPAVFIGIGVLVLFECGTLAWLTEQIGCPADRTAQS